MKKLYKNIIGKHKYFVYKGTWENNYEWRIEKVKITGIKINKQSEFFVEFSFNCVGYNYPYSSLKNTLKEAKKLAVKQIEKEKARQIKTILSYKGTNQ